MGVKSFINNVRNLAKVNLQSFEQRSSEIFTLLNGSFGRWWFGGGDNDLCDTISSKQALRISTVFTCTLVRAESLSSLPASVKQFSEKGSRTAYEHPTHRLIHDKPNPFQTASDFWKTVSLHIDLYGNCFVKITYTKAYRASRLDIICDPRSVQIMRSENGEAYYDYDGKRYKSYEMLHFKDLSLDGYYGCSRISYNSETLGYARKLKNYGSNAVGNKPPGYFSTDATYDVVKKQQEALSEGWNSNIANGKTPLLPFGLKYNNLMISPGEAQYLDAIGATKEDIYGIFRVPPTLAQNYERATFANAEQQDLVFVKYTLLPLVTNIEQECNAKLFSEDNDTSRTPYYVKFNTGALLRGDFKTRTEGYRTLFNIGAINGDTIADLEDWNKWEGGDRRFIPMNMIPLDKVDEFISTLTEPIGSTASDPGGSQQERSFTIKDFRNFLIKSHVNGHEKEFNGHEN